jgi:prepilin-type N-terminal cleavage/methylation domain-containing protein
VFVRVKATVVLGRLLAYDAVRMASRRATHAWRRRGGRAGFTLAELLAVVALVAILALVAMPAMGRARDDRRAYDDAGAVVQLVRSARAQALARGGAVMVSMTAGGQDRGTFQVWQGRGGCLGTNWGPKGEPAPVLVEGVSLNGTRDAQADIRAKLSSIRGREVSSLAVCFTPLGRAYVSSVVPPEFTPSDVMTGALQVTVTRGDGLGIERRVLVPPSGAARLFSQ